MYLSKEHTKHENLATEEKSNEAKAMNVNSYVRLILLINCNLLSFRWIGMHHTLAYTIYTHVFIVRYAKQLKSFTLSNFTWLCRAHTYTIHLLHSPTNCECSWVFYFNHHPLATFHLSVSFYFGISYFVRFYITLTFAIKITINRCQQESKAGFFFTKRKKVYQPVFISKQFSHIIHTTHEHIWRKENVTVTPNNLAKICIRNWIKMQTYYSQFAINVNECHIKWVQKSRVYCTTME